MDVSLLPASAQAEMAALSIDSGIISSLTGTPSQTTAPASLFATPPVTVDISEEARAAASEAAPGPGWEAGYDQGETGFETGEQA